MGCCGKTIGEVHSKTRHIISGWSSLVLQKPSSEAKRRLTICRNCASNRWKGLRMWCRECYCYIPAKVRVPEEKCKLGKW